MSAEMLKVSIRSSNNAPSRQECVVSYQIINTGNKLVRPLISVALIFPRMRAVARVRTPYEGARVWRVCRLCLRPCRYRQVGSAPFFFNSFFDVLPVSVLARSGCVRSVCAGLIGPVRMP